MDIAKTISLLQSQIPNNISKDDEPLTSEIQTTAEETLVAETEETFDTPTEVQQTTGEDFSTFLTLLTAQIKNQDPLAPLDSTQFVEQLATFTNLELQAKGNQSLEQIAILLERQIELLTPTETPSTSPETDVETTV